MFHHLPAIFSSLFRLASYLFLRVVPSRLGKPILPALYLLHLVATWCCPPPSDDPPPNWQEKNVRPPPRCTTSALSVLCFSLPTRSRTHTWTNIAINTLLLLAAADLIFTPFIDDASDLIFTRVGAVYPDSAKIVARYPLENATLTLLYRESSKSLDWKVGPGLNLTHQSDWVDTVRLENLWPGTSYEYVLADQNNTILLEAPIQFRTFPDPRLHAPSHFRFLATSCITPNFPYRGPLHKRTIAGFDHLADYLQSSHPEVLPEQQPVENATGNVSLPQPAQNLTQAPPPTEFLLFLGDFIYADVPTYIGDDQEAYRRLYRRNYQSPSFKRVYEQLPIFHAYDDHEFINNYIGNASDLPPFPNAANAYNIYAGNPNYDPVQPGQNFYDFRHGDTAFFVMDTRRYRSSPPNPESEQGETYRTMLGDGQLTALYEWLHKVNQTSTFKFIVSSVPFTSLWTHDAQTDSWAGFSTEKAALLEAFHSVPNVIIISGDRHEFAAIEFAAGDSSKSSHVVREFSTSPLNMFYIPYIHTLLPRSAAAFTRNVTTVVTKEDGELQEVEVEIEVPYEKTIAYIPHGNTKWSTFEIDTRDPNKPTLRLETVIDGKPAYHLEIIGAPTRPPNYTGLGSLVTTNVLDLFDKIGLRPAKWF